MADRLSKRIQIVMVEPDQYAQIATAFHSIDLNYDDRREELEMPAVMENVSWQQYESLLEALPERYLRQAYFRGTLELREKTMLQQRTKWVIGRLITATAFEFGIPIASFGSTTRTIRDLECGVEPDESYFLEHQRAVRGLHEVDLEHWPPPDLVVETDLDHAYLDRRTVFGVLGVPEVWRYDGTDLVFYRLTKQNEYEPIEASRSFPFIRTDDIVQFVKQLHKTDDTTLTKAFIRHVRRCYENWRGELQRTPKT